MIIVSYYWIWNSRMFDLTVKVCCLSPAPPRPPKKRQELAVFPALNITAALLYHISLLLCQVQPQKPPTHPLLLRWLSDSPILLNNAYHWTNAFNWQLEPINTEASSQGYGATQYIYVHIHEWKYIFSRICKRTVESLCVTGLCLSWKGPWDV